MSEHEFRPCTCGSDDIHLNITENRRGSAMVYTVQCKNCLRRTRSLYAMYTGQFKTCERTAVSEWNHGHTYPGGHK